VVRRRVALVDVPDTVVDAIGGGSAYARYLVKALESTCDLRLLGRGSLTGAGPASWLRRAVQQASVRGAADIWIQEPSSAAFAAAQRIRGRRVLLVHHIDSRFLASPRLASLLESWLYSNLKRFDIVVTVAKYWQEQFSSKGHRDVRVIYNAFDVESFELEDDEVVAFRQRHGLVGKPIVYLGNCQYAKGVVQAYEALKELDVHLVTSGERRVNIGAANLNVSYRDYLALLKASSVVVTMSLFNEGWNRTAHEAMLCGTPVVGSGTGGMRELLEGGGQVVCPNFTGLAAAVGRAIGGNPSGSRGREFARQFTYERFRVAWETLLEETLCGR
jgi:glycosyltransferase involved in cell wall biosynthesis